VPDYAVIGDVSATLTATLTDALSVIVPVPPPIAQVHDLVGNVSMDPPTLTVFLYEIVEDATVKNRPPIRSDVPPDTFLRRAPMGLMLRYLVTPWSNDRLTDQQMLGRAMQALHDNAILTGPWLRGGLIGTTEALKVSLNPLTIEDRTRIWHAVHKPYRISVAYEVRVVNIESLTERTVVPVANRVLDGAVPGPA
jgi:hypothetical protein